MKVLQQAHGADEERACALPVGSQGDVKNSLDRAEEAYLQKIFCWCRLESMHQRYSLALCCDMNAQSDCARSAHLPLARFPLTQSFANQSQTALPPRSGKSCDYKLCPSGCLHVVEYTTSLGFQPQHQTVRWSEATLNEWEFL